MDYYEELGVPRSASQDDIRRAWKRLARLCHPDLQTDPEMRETAEVQMRRLNHVLSILTQPWERAQYDLLLHSEQSGAAHWDERPVRRNPARELFRFDRKAAVWLACGTLIAGVLAVIVLASLRDQSTTDRAAGTDVAVARASSLPDATASLESRIDQLRKRYPPPAEPSHARTKSSVEEEPVPAEIPPVRGKPAAPAASPPGTVVPAPARVENRTPEPKQSPVAAPPVVRSTPLPELPRTLPPLPPSSAAPPPESARPVPPAAGLEGLWRYSPARQIAQKPGLYSADHVEVGVSEESGVLYGYYTAHYLVPEGSVSPDVAFKFSGASGGGAATGTWSGVNGNRGEIRLRVLSNNALEVVWVTTHMEHANSLASGKVTLFRAN